MRAALVAVAVGTVLVVSACGGDDADAEALPTPSPTATPESTPGDSSSEPTSTPTASAADLHSDEKVLEDYFTAREAFAAAYDPPNPDHPDLLATYGGDALEGTQRGLEDLIEDGHSYIVEYEHNAEVVVREPDAAIVRDCYRDRSQLIDTETRESIGEQGSDVSHVDTTLEIRDGNWIIVHRRKVEGSCTPPS